MSCESINIHDEITELQQNRLRLYGHVLLKDEIDFVKICVDCEDKRVYDL